MNKQPALTRKRKSSFKNFDPFNDRMSRDIRNTLSEAFVDAVVRMEQFAYRNAAQRWLAKNLADGYIDYIHERLKRYDRAFEQIRAGRLDDVLLQVLVIWNHGLFFEVHDHLERIWKQTTGDKHQALKGLIKAAGAYIHMESSRRQTAERLAIKSRDLIRQHTHCLTFIANLNMLLHKLERLDPIPPRLEGRMSYQVDLNSC